MTNLTQAFVFETDDLDSLRMALEAILRIITKGNGRRASLRVITDKQPFSFNDGSLKTGRPTRRWLATAGIYLDEGRGRSPESAVPAMLSAALSVSEKQFFDEFGIPEFDGSVRSGWRLHYSGPGDLIHLSRIHTFHEK